MTPTSPTRRPARTFELVVEHSDRTDGRYGVTIVETNGRPEHAREVAYIPPQRLDATIPALVDALQTSGHRRTTLHAGRTTPIPLHEAAGVRAALAAHVVRPVSKPGRAAQLIDGISRLSDEECFYWYAHTIGVRDHSIRRRRLKALRIFLAEE
jgi:hypothetical protein